MPDRKERREKVIEVLNKARSMELKAIHQYMNHHYSLDDMDFGELAANMKLVAIDEMRHAEAFAERIKELGGEPTAEADGKIAKRQDIKAMYPFDADGDDETIDAYNGFLKVCQEMGDIVSVKVFEQIIEDEQEHFNYFDSVADHIDTLGDAYLSRIAGTPSSTGLAPQGFAVTGKI